MQIALVSTPYLTVPPDTWGGIESQVHYLAKGLHELGHEVTVIARPGSKSPGQLIETFEGDVDDAELEHFKCYAPFLLNWDGVVLDFSNTKPAHNIWPDRTWNCIHWYCWPLRDWKNLVAISEALAEWLRERTSEPVHVVHNCIDPNEFEFRDGGDYYLFFSKINRGKGADVALELAKETGKPFHFAGVSGDMSGEVERCGLPNVTFHGDVSVERRRELFRDAKALVFPTGGFGRTAWTEAFGVVMLEALASGTPVIAADNGAVKEVVKPRVGFVCDSYAQMKGVVERDLVDGLSPEWCRRYVEQHFSYKKAAAKYLDLWKL